MPRRPVTDCCSRSLRPPGASRAHFYEFLNAKAPTVRLGRRRMVRVVDARGIYRITRDHPPRLTMAYRLCTCPPTALMPRVAVVPHLKLC